MEAVRAVLLSEDSPLRRLPTAATARQRMTLDGIRYSIEMIELAYHRLRGGLEDISTGQGAPGGVFQPGDTDMPRGVFAGVLLDAWVIVDSAHRLQELLVHMPDVKRTADWKASSKHLDLFDAPRNAVQHLATEISKVTEIGRAHV